jgi:hypothetical protein
MAWHAGGKAPAAEATAYLGEDPLRAGLGAVDGVDIPDQSGSMEG